MAVLELASVPKTPYQGLKPMTHSDTRREVDGKQLRALRESLGMSQKQLAELLGVQRVTITRAEGTEERPSKPSRLLQSLLDQALARGVLKIPPESKKKRQTKKRP
jgi:transcriptional regulator with XRE-family HTH domain